MFTSVAKPDYLTLKKERTVDRSSSLTHSYKISILTPSELKVLKLIGEGLRNHEIAERLFNSEETVKKHIYNMFQKMEVKNRLSLVAKAKEIGILE